MDTLCKPDMRFPYPLEEDELHELVSRQLKTQTGLFFTVEDEARSKTPLKQCLRHKAARVPKYVNGVTDMEGIYDEVIEGLDDNENDRVTILVDGFDRVDVTIPINHGEIVVGLLGRHKKKIEDNEYCSDELDNSDPNDFEKYALCFGFSVSPINGQDMWPKVQTDEQQPHVYNNGPRRPMNVRIREYGEDGARRRRPDVAYKCTKCDKLVHNALSCKSFTQDLNVLKRNVNVYVQVNIDVHANVNVQDHVDASQAVKMLYLRTMQPILMQVKLNHLWLTQVGLRQVKLRENKTCYEDEKKGRVKDRS
ncbi:hypothetical protein KIW84_022261 [Lathyrus oleraceus]|uniref:Uncharacterized protein n=1 Tax=Pisum sativum TaxID=3888 RepID=A0A9D4YA66_PEA|nr:hypothetical protein KIW84_022261 [Pisum sativum]